MLTDKERDEVKLRVEADKQLTDYFNILKFEVERIKEVNNLLLEERQNRMVIYEAYATVKMLLRDDAKRMNEAYFNLERGEVTKAMNLLQLRVNEHGR